MGFKYAIIEASTKNEKSGFYILPGRYETKEEAEHNLKIILKACPHKSKTYSIKTVENGIWE